MRLPLLVFHISAGVLAMFAGAAAMSFRKGSRSHGVAGNVFVVSMLSMAAAASCLAFMKHQSNNVFGGLLTIYMVATAWATARRRDGETSILDWLRISVCVHHRSSQRVPRTPKDDRPGASRSRNVCFHAVFYGFGILLAGLGDLRVILRGISGRRRIARHLWRMCFGWFIATGSFFLDNNRYFPLGSADHPRSWCRHCCH